MKINEPDQSWHVILSAAKNLPRRAEILRFTQNDMAELDRQSSSLRRHGSSDLR
jgi:hypothetical protein